MLYNLIRKLLFLMDPEQAHILTLKYLNSKKIQYLINFLYNSKNNKKTICMGLKFNNKIGIAAGIDKNGEYINALSKFGFGFIEIGTVTPLPQYGNPKPRLFRIESEEGIINRMGFNNLGIDNLIQNIKKSHFKGIIGVNIGKNKTTSIQNAVYDYLTCIEKVYIYASYIAINISSPNTKNLRTLQHGSLLSDLLSQVKKNK